MSRAAQPPSNVTETKTTEKVYRINDHGRVLKRSLKPAEYYILENGEPFIPDLVVEGLQNEAACMAFVRRHTNIPVPRLLETYEEDGAYHLWMEYIDGVEMSELTDEEKLEVLPQVRRMVTILQRIRSTVSGGPTGILSPPSIVFFDHYDPLAPWKQRTTTDEFVFCHGDLSQHNILVDPRTLRIAAIVDWESGGFFPAEHEISFYESSEYSGVQVKGDKHRTAVANMIDFWRQSRAAERCNPNS